MASEEKAKRPISSYIWGRTLSLSRPVRIAILVFVAAGIVAMSFSQLGFWPLCVIDEKSVYLMLLVAPLVAGALLFGPLTGVVLGLLAGASAFAHATFFPLDYYEVYFMTPLNAFTLFPILGAGSGFLFDFALRRQPQGAARIGRIALVCLVASFAASGLTMLNTVAAYGGLDELDAIRELLFNSPLGVVVQALVDAVVVVSLCLILDYCVRYLSNVGDAITLTFVFRVWMTLVSSVVFMLTSAFIFSISTLQCQSVSQAAMQSEIRYLEKQIALQEVADFDELLDGYEVPLDGYVMITDEMGKIIASNDDGRFTIGDMLRDEIGYGNSGYTYEAFASEVLNSFAESGEMGGLQALSDDGVQTMDLVFAAAGEYNGGYIVMLRLSDLVYESRFGTMAASTLLAIALIAAIGVLANVLLSRLVVRRIDETNDSLAKITHGNLDERVRVRDTAEFTSLSSGINTTVGALKDTIDEVKQRNAQDLATAKTIQESALPREFPPFPLIDKFDIYASMKTAREVGGDFYDFFLIGDREDKLGFVMADVSGKGIPAALFMMAAKTQIRNYMEADLPLGEAIAAANHQLCIGNDAGMFVTMWVGMLEYETGLLTYVNAGHNPPLILHDDEWKWMRDVSGMPLGLFDGLPYETFTRQLETGDMLYLYTDGVTEAMNLGGELFSEERLEQTLYVYKDMNPRSVGVGVRRALTDYTMDAEQSDDITMLIMKYGVPPEKRAMMVLEARVDQLIHVFNFIHEELHRRSAPKWVYNPLDIAAEELFVNVCHYAYPDATPENPGEVRISFEYEATPPTLTVQISDEGIPYNPLAKPDAVTPDDIADVPIGGLGILMAKRSVDDMLYERMDGSNVLTIVKKW